MFASVRCSLRHRRQRRLRLFSGSAGGPLQERPRSFQEQTQGCRPQQDGQNEPVRLGRRCEATPKGARDWYGGATTEFPDGDSIVIVPPIFALMPPATLHPASLAFSTTMPPPFNLNAPRRFQAEHEDSASMRLRCTEAPQKDSVRLCFGGVSLQKLTFL